MTVSSLTGMNVGQEMLSGVSYPSFSNTDIDNLWARGYRKFRVASGDYSYNAGLTYIKQLVQYIATKNPTVLVVGVDTPGGSFKSTTWAAFAQAVKDFAQWCQQNGVTHVQIANEKDAYFNLPTETASATRSGSVITVTWSVPHGYNVGEAFTISNASPITTSSGETVATVPDQFTFTFSPHQAGSDGTAASASFQPSPSTVVSRLKTLSTQIKALSNPTVTIPLLYSVAQGYVANWSGGRGNIDILGLDIYGETSGDSNARFDNFVSQVDTMYATHGANMWITEWNLHASAGSFPTNKSEQRYWIRKRFSYLEAKGIPHFFFAHRSNSHSGNQNDNFAAHYRWATGGLSDGGERWLDIIENRRPNFKDLNT